MRVSLVLLTLLFSGSLFAQMSGVGTSFGLFPSTDRLYNDLEFNQWIGKRMSGPTDGHCPTAKEDDGDKDEVTEDLEEEAPDSGGLLLTQLTEVERSSADVLKSGYYLFGAGDERIYGTERTVWRLKKAGQLLAKDGMAMGIGDISKKGGDNVHPHMTHKKGQDVDLRLLDKNGVASVCNYRDSDCYDRSKTFKMIKTLIDVDPTKVKKVFINDPSLRSMVNSYYRDAAGDRGTISFAASGYDNIISFSWKD
jgi:hypothetical protein